MRPLGTTFLRPLSVRLPVGRFLQDRAVVLLSERAKDFADTEQAYDLEILLQIEIHTVSKYAEESIKIGHSSSFGM